MGEIVNDDGILRYPCHIDKFGARPIIEDGALTSSPVLGDGVVALLSTYGSDQSIAETARVSYGKGTKRSNDTAGLIRYLMRHRHTSPFEHAEVSFYMRLPIFVVRQLFRHRTANINEYSARYSELSSEFYVPAPSHIAKQSTSNKQGRGDIFGEDDALPIAKMMFGAQQQGFDTYQELLNRGAARELARVVTSVGTFTEFYWKCDLHNLLHFLKLRMDTHAQREIRDVATIMYRSVKPFFTETIRAWEDYVWNASTLSIEELRLLRQMIDWSGYHTRGLIKSTRMTEREFADFKGFIDKLNDI